MLNYQLTKLDNGLRVITAPLKNTRAVTVLFLFNVGSRYENEKVSGISHFLEHMFFKGTKKRPTSLDISRELDNVGATYNAYTGDEYTGYFVRITSEHFDLGFDILTDMIFNSLFDAAEIEREKGVIVEEINMYNDEPRAKVENVAKELFYGAQPLGRKVTGEKETVMALKRENFLDYEKTFYRPSNMLVAVAGDGLEEEWLTKIKEKFGARVDEKAPTYEKVIESQTEPQVAVSYKETDQAHFILGFRSLKRTDKRRPALKVLSNLMGQMMSSRLFVEIREKRGLCYYIGSDMMDFHDTGAWAVSAGVDIRRIEEAIEATLAEIKRIKTENISDEELSRAKENLKGHMYLSLEESMQVADFLAEQELLWGNIKDPDQVAAELEKVTADEIKELANVIFDRKNLNLAVVGPFKEKEKFEQIISKYETTNPNTNNTNNTNN